MKKGEHRTFDIYRDEKGNYLCKFFEKKPVLGNLKVKKTAEAYIPGIAEILYFVVVCVLGAFQEEDNKIIS